MAVVLEINVDRSLSTSGPSGDRATRAGTVGAQITKTRAVGRPPRARARGGAPPRVTFEPTPEPQEGPLSSCSGRRHHRHLAGVGPTGRRAGLHGLFDSPSRPSDPRAAEWRPIAPHRPTPGSCCPMAPWRSLAAPGHRRKRAAQRRPPPHGVSHASGPTTGARAEATVVFTSRPSIGAGLNSTVLPARTMSAAGSTGSAGPS